MSGRLTVRDRRLLIGTGACALALVVLTTIFASSEGEESRAPTTYSADSGGTKAAYLLLRDSGYSVRRWERSPIALADEKPATLMLLQPETPPGEDERKAIADFLRRGGRVIATGSFATSFIPDATVQPEPRVADTWSRIKAIAPSPITAAANEITMDPSARWSGDSSAVALYGEGDKVRVVRYRVGAGDVLWWASSTPLTNAGIRERGNLEFVLACLGDPTTPILWDEYFHGHRDTPLAAIAASPFEWTVVPLALVVIAMLATYSRRSGPIIPVQEQSRLSPLEFVRTLGGLYQTARGASIAVDVAYARFRYRLTQKLGLAVNSSIEQIERVAAGRLLVRRSLGEGGKAAPTRKAAAQTPTAPTYDGLGDLLRECETARHRYNLSPNAALQLTQRLGDYSAKLGLS